MEILETNNNTLKEIEKLDSWTKAGIKSHSTFKSDFYRLIIYPSWQDSEVSEYMLENGREKPKISITRYKRLNSEEGSLKKIGETEETILSEKAWEQLDNLMEDQCFWTMPIRSESMYLDGTSWIFEGKKSVRNNCSDQNYHVVTRVANSPKYFDLCDSLLRLGKSSKKEQDSLLYKSWTKD